MKFIKTNTEEITERVQDLLLLPGDLPRFEIAYTDKKGVRKAFLDIYKVKKKYIAFYSPRTKTIYIDTRWLNERILAHEICHVILDHEFKGRMPGQMQERECQRIETFF